MGGNLPDCKDWNFFQPAAQLHSVHIAGVGRQDDDFRIGKFPANRDHRIQAVHFGHLQVHPSDVGPVLAELLNRFPAIHSLRYKAHVRLCRQDPGQPLSEHRVVIHG
jgi:hypothetical protein